MFNRAPRLASPNSFPNLRIGDGPTVTTTMWGDRHVGFSTGCELSTLRKSGYPNAPPSLIYNSTSSPDPS
jgi:hypothetical protein